MKKQTLLLLLVGLMALPSSVWAQMGKIWYTDQNLFVNLPGNGIVIIDNRDVLQPQKLGYVDIPGNVDLAVNGNYLYANSFQDLLVLDISNPQSPQEIGRQPNVFTHRRNLGNANVPSIVWTPGNNPLGSILQGLALGRRNSPIQIGPNASTFGINPTINSFNQAPQRSNPGNTSKGGSMACFTIHGGYMYAIDSQDLLVFSLANPAQPQAVGIKTRVNTDIETVFADGTRLYIGSQTGMYIYDIRKPEAPARIGHYRHTRSCDPVVVSGNYAFVTLRAGSECGGGQNLLEVIDISDPARPHRLSSYDMNQPYGLGIDGNMLFVCD
ncbi:MAG: hypothetical protein HC913_16590, partial [Microscillaceae bacterium]|nr:hypothetical protein [Microscillaceae bacterium]